MIKQQLSLVLANKKCVFGILLVFFTSFLVFVYQENRNNTEGRGRQQCISWNLSEEEPVQALQEHMTEIFQIDGMQNLMFAPTQFEEYVICCDVLEYLRTTMNYEEAMLSILENQHNLQSLPYSSPIEKAKAKLLERQYEKCLEKEILPENLIGFEHYFQTGVVEYALLLCVILLCYFSVACERETGVCQFIYATKNGGVRFFVAKYISIALLVSVLNFITKLLKLSVLFGMYGKADLNTAIQSMNGYLYSPWHFTIGQLICVDFVWGMAGLLLVAMIVMLIHSLAVSATVSVILSALLLGVSFLMQFVTPTKEWMILLQDISLFRITNIDYWIHGYRIYRIVQNEQFAYFLTGFTLPVLAGIVRLVIYSIVLMRLYYIGTRKSNARQHRVRLKRFSYRFGLFWNEGYFICVQKKMLFAVFAMIAFYVIVIGDFSPKNYENVRLEREYIERLNEMELEEAGEWLGQKISELEALEQTRNEMQALLEAGEISSETFSKFSEQVMNRMAIKPIIDELLQQQATREEYYHANGKIIQFEFTALSREFFSAEGRSDRSWISLLVGAFVAFVVMSYFPDERYGEKRRLLGSSMLGIRSIYLKTVWMVLLVLGLYFTLSALWITSLNIQYGLTGWETAVQSWEHFREWNSNLTVGTGIVLESAFYAALWGVAAMIGSSISFLFMNSVWSQLIGFCLFVVPSVLGICELLGDSIRINPLCYGEWSMAMAVRTILLFGCAMVTAVVFVWRSKKWISPL